MYFLLATRRILFSATCFCGIFVTVAANAQQTEMPFLTTKQPLTLLSANDGAVMKVIEPTLESATKDSVTLIRLGPNHPPIVRTVYGTVPNTIGGPPHMAISHKGRFGFVTNHSLGFTDVSDAKAENGPNAVTVIDLKSPNLKVIEQIELPPYPVMAHTHPDGRRVLVGGGYFFHVLAVDEDTKRIKVAKYEVSMFVTGFDVSPNGDRIIATGTRSPKKTGNQFVAWDAEVHMFHWKSGSIRHQGRVGDGEFTKPLNGPFSPRFGPAGKRAFVLNGLGVTPRGELDDLVVIDLTGEEPCVSGLVRQLGDGLESLAVHPSGDTVVVSCLDGHSYTSHIAVVDLRADPPRLLYHLPVTPIPEGIEFSPDGKMLFLGCTGGHHIKVFDVVDGNDLVRNPYVIRTGHCPASLAISGQ